MTTLPLWLQNVVALSLQIAILTAASALLAYALRLRHPAAKLVYWQLILLVCFALPVAQPWKALESLPAVRYTAVARDLPALPAPKATAQRPSTFSIRPGDAFFFLLAGGAALRFVWLGIGFYALRRFRKTSRPFDPLPSSIQDAQDRLGVSAAFALSNRIPGPITFGIRRPLILLPSRVFDMTAGSQLAIAYHELIHVRRRDWVWTAFEEVVLGILWFHPAVWWLVGQIRLAREQVVDSETVALTKSGNQYVEALLAVAGFDHETLLAPAALFLERRHLVERITSVLKEESNMSKKTLITLFAAGLVAVLAVARLAVAVFPVHAIVHHEAVDQKEPVQVVSGGEYLLHGGHVGYPESAIKQKIAGTVVVEFTTDARGQVTDARVLSGPEQLRKAALSSVLEWHYDPARHAAGTAQAAISFQPPQEREGDTGITVKVDEGFLHKRLAETQHQLEHLQHHGSGAEHAQRHGSEAEEARLMREIVELNQAIERGGTFEVRTVEARSSEPHLRERLAKAQQQLERSSDAGSREEVAKIERQIHELKTAMAEREETVGPARVRSIRTDGVSEASRDNLMNRLGVHVGDQIDDAKMREIQETLRGIDEHLRLRTERGHDGTVALIIIVRD